MSSPWHPYSSQAESLTAQYRAWDYRLRGYDLWEYPVTIEPPFGFFEPDYGRTDVIDDSRKHTFLSGLVAKTTDWFSGNEDPDRVDTNPEEEAFLAELFIPEDKLLELQIALPPQIDYSVGRMEQFLRNCKGLKLPMSVEFIGTENQIVVQMSCREPDAALVFQQVGALFPEAIMTQEPRFLERAFTQSLESYAAVDYGLETTCAVPMAIDHRFEVDPLATLIAALAEVGENEAAVVQFLFSPVSAPWSDAIVRSLLCNDGSCFFSDAPHLLGDAESKTSRPLFATLVRTCVNSPSRSSTKRQLQHIGSALSQFNTERGQGLMPLHNDGYPDDLHLVDIVARVTHRSGMLLNSAELSLLAHLPQSSVTHKKLVRCTEKTKEAPLIALGHDLVLGQNRHRGNERTVTLSPQHRLRHTYVVGASGTGKSTLLAHMLRQDIVAGRGVALLDPHGDLVDDVLDFIPKERVEEVVLFDPSDEEFPIGFNILDARSDAEKTLIASDMVATFRRLSTSWGDQMNAVLANGIIAILEHEDGGTLMTLRRFLVEKAFREKYLRGVQDSEVLYYWNKEYPLLRGHSHASVLTRLDTFLRSKIVRNMVAQQANRIDFSSIMSRKKIFLAKLPQGAIGEENASLLGTLLVTALNQAAQRRQSLDTESRLPFYVYIDEFQNFVTPTMESILSGSRKYGVALTLAHQDLRQLTSKSRDIASSVLANPCTRVCFRCGDSDSATLAKGLSSFEAHDLQSLGIGEAVSRIEQAQYDFNLRIPAPTDNSGPSLEKEIVVAVRKAYASDKRTVESDIASLYGRHYASESQKAKTPVPGAPKRDTATRDSTKPAEVRVTAESLVDEQQSTAQLSGRGGQQHKYLQSLIKKLALDRGFGAETEAKILGGHGAVDVLLTNGESKIACEITITTPAEHEVQNIQKCLAAGVDSVVLIGQNREKLRSVRSLLKGSFDAEILKKIQLLSPDEFVSYLDTVQANTRQGEKRVRGYKVNVSYTSTTKTEQKQKQDAIAKFIIDSMRRIRENDK